MSTSKSLLALARVPVQGVLARLGQLRIDQWPLPAPVQRFVQGSMHKLLRDFPLLGELLERSRTVIDRVAGTSGRSAPVSVTVSERTVTHGEKPVTATQAALSPQALQCLLEELRGPSVEPAVTAIERLAASGDRQAHAALLSVVDNVDGFFHPLVRVAALRALAADRSVELRQAVIAAVDSVSAEVSLAAIAVIAQFPPLDGLGPLRRVVDDRSGYFAPEVVGAAERALSRFSVS